MIKQKVTFLEQTWKTIEFTGETEDDIEEQITEALDDIYEIIDFEHNPDDYQCEVVKKSEVKKVKATNIGFMNDETQFDTTDEKELAQLWWQFCKENKIVTYTEEVEA